MNREIILVMVLLIALAALAAISFNNIRVQVEEQGLKSIVEQIWYGNKGIR